MKMLLGELKQRWRIIRDRSLPGERRVFALLEAVFMPVSFVTLAALLVVPALGAVGVPSPTWLHGPLVTILVSAAIGYITNWIAIEMLFKPYRPTARHPFAWITCGYWRQGLVPKNKGEIADVLGEQVATKLLQPEKIADDLCAMIGGILRNERIISSVRDGVRSMLAAHDQEIASFLAPRIETALVAEVDRLVTVEKVEDFWSEHVEPKLRSTETRDEIATLVITALERRAPSLAAKAKPLVVAAVANFVEEKGGLAGPILALLAERIADYLVSRRTIETGLPNWLESPDTVPALRDELLQFVTSVRNYVKSDATRGKMGAFVGEIRSTFKAYVHGYIKSNLVDVAGRILNSESLWQSVADMIPQFQPELERLVRTEGMPLIMERLAIRDRIKTAVDKMDVAEFHGMINEVAAQHLGAIQVLGYLLGAAAGALTLLI